MNSSYEGTAVSPSNMLGCFTNQGRKAIDTDDNHAAAQFLASDLLVRQHEMRKAVQVHYLVHERVWEGTSQVPSPLGLAHWSRPTDTYRLFRPVCNRRHGYSSELTLE
jgi:hypothetical protein